MNESVRSCLKEWKNLNITYSLIKFGQWFDSLPQILEIEVDKWLYAAGGEGKK